MAFVQAQGGRRGARGTISVAELLARANSAPPAPAPSRRARTSGCVTVGRLMSREGRGSGRAADGSHAFGLAVVGAAVLFGSMASGTPLTDNGPIGTRPEALHPGMPAEPFGGHHTVVHTGIGGDGPGPALPGAVGSAAIAPPAGTGALTSAGTGPQTAPGATPHAPPGAVSAPPALQPSGPGGGAPPAAPPPAAPPPAAGERPADPGAPPAGRGPGGGEAEQPRKPGHGERGHGGDRDAGNGNAQLRAADPGERGESGNARGRHHAADPGERGESGNAPGRHRAADAGERGESGNAGGPHRAADPGDDEPGG